jgi:hypothetical protein
MPKIVNSNKNNFVNQTVFLKKDYIEIGGFCGLGSTKVPTDQITNFSSEIDSQLGSSTASKLGGAVVGGLLFGGIGAVVGVVSSGNNKKIQKRLLSFEINNTDWFTAEFDNSWTENLFFKEFMDKFSEKQLSPFAN